MRPLLAVATAFLVLVPAAAASPMLGIKGSIPRFAELTGQQSTVDHVIVGWDQGAGWGSKFTELFKTLGPTPMIGLSTRGRNGKEAITPRQIAQGAGDGYLIALNNAVSEWGRRIYIRPFGEMNGYWNVYCAFTKGGTPKPNHSTADFRKAFARVYLIVHGGPATAINAKLRKLGMPPLQGDLPENPMPDTRVVWNPQGFGAPDIPANSAQAYYPGDPYVDVVGNDLYDQRGKAEWDANEALYKRTRTSRTRSPSGACGGSTIPSSSARWGSSCARTGAPRCSPTSRACPARSSTSGPNRRAAPPTAR